MSIQVYNKALTNGNTGTASNLIYGDFIVKLAIRRQGNGKVVVREVPFGMCGASTGTKVDLQEAAVKMAEKIAKLSDGVVMGLFEKLGKYRNDENPAMVHDLRKQYGVIFMSNNQLAENPAALGPYPLKTVTSKVFVPWLADDVSRQDMIATLKEPITVNTVDYMFGYSRFANSDKTSIEVFPMQYNAGCQTKEFNKIASFELVNNDVSSGISDNVMSEENATIVDGDDDQGA